MNKVAIGIAGLIGAGLIGGAGWWIAQKIGNRPNPPQQRSTKFDYRAVAKWAISYSDAEQGYVEGVAVCDWKTPWCHLRLREHGTGELRKVTADAKDITLPRLFHESDDPLVLTLHGRFPSGDAIDLPPEPGPVLHAGGPGTATIKIKNGDVESQGQVPISWSAAADHEKVTFAMDPDEDGGFSGHWAYYANPLTERSAAGFGPVGAFNAIRDEDVPERDDPNQAGGFLGVQTGRVSWQPLPPKIYQIVVLEDQAAYDNGLARYPHARTSNTRLDRNLRHLVVFGRDLPVDDDKPVFDMGSAEKDVSYKLTAVAGTDHVSDDDRQRFERAWRLATDGMAPEEVTDFRKLDAVIVEATLGDGADPGDKTITWGTARYHWPLQYGDNAAAVRFVRVFNEKEKEAVVRPMLPEEVYIEVETEGTMSLDDIPVLLGGSAVHGGQRSYVAHRVAGNDRIYRTQKLLFADPVYHGPDRKQPSSDGDPVTIDRGAHILATVDRAKANFLRASIADAESPQYYTEGPPNTSEIWLHGLYQAAQCDLRPFDEAHWEAFARQPITSAGWQLDGMQDAVRAFGQGLIGYDNGQTFYIDWHDSKIDIHFGDLAAMILLRDTFVDAMRAQQTELQAALNATGDRGDRLTAIAAEPFVDGWYRNMHDVVTRVRDSPLAELIVNSPAGPVPFLKAYDDDFRESTFHTWTTADGMGKYLTWRRAATREAMKSYAATLNDAIAAAAKINRCDVFELLKLTGAGFQNISTQLDPLLMKYQPSSGLYERDMPARAYVNELDTLARAVDDVKGLRSQTNKAIITAAASLAGPGAGFIWGKLAGTIVGVVGNLATFGYETANMIYETYQEHEEVRLAFGGASTLGLERYFDVDSRSTPWWQVGVVIFGDAVMQGIGLAAEKQPLIEGLSEWRGGRLLARLERLGLAETRALPPIPQRDLAVFILKEEQRLAALGAAGGATKYAARAFDELGTEAGAIKQAAAQEPLAATEIQRAALQPIDDFKTAILNPNDPVRDVKIRISEGDVVEDASAGRADAETRVADPAGAETADRVANPVELGVPEPVPVPNSIPLPYRMPIPNERWTTTIKVNGSDVHVSFDVGEVISEDSAFFNVYRLKSKDGIPAGLLSDKLGDDLVIKISKHNSAQLGKFNQDFPGIAEHVVERMLAAEKRLGDKVEHLHIEGFDDPGIILQERFKKEPGVFEVFSATKTRTRPGPNGELIRLLTPFERRALLDPAKNRAIARLCRQLVDADLGWLDFNFGNIYLKKHGTEWVAGILDQDFIGTLDELTEGVYNDYLNVRVRYGARSPYNGIKNVKDLMGKILEAYGWLEYSTAERRLVRGVLSPDEVREAIPDLPFLDPPTLPNPVAPSSPATPPTAPLGGPAPAPGQPPTVPHPGPGQTPTVPHSGPGREGALLPLPPTDLSVAA